MLDAPYDAVYEAIVDYENLHPRIIPSPPFQGLEVVEGGRGAGTVIRVSLKAGGRTQTARGEVAEPEPGRIVETYDSGYVTSFQITRVGEGRTQVSIGTVMPPRGGVLGSIERWLVARMLQPVYRRELVQLEAVAREWAAARR